MTHDSLLKEKKEPYEKEGCNALRSFKKVAFGREQEEGHFRGGKKTLLLTQIKRKNPWTKVFPSPKEKGEDSGRQKEKRGRRGKGNPSCLVGGRGKRGPVKGNAYREKKKHSRPREEEEKVRLLQGDTTKRK